ncbi:MAG: FAD-dependent oxidoreductase [Gammaproteobacteria bacterium]
MTYQWAIIGAGPAGIAAVGELIDQGVNPSSIAWIDPNFTVGDFGALWQNVPSNTKVNLFLKFLNSVDAFEYKTCTENFALNQADPHHTCRLGMMAEPLQWVTEQLKKKVKAIKGTAENLALSERTWKIKLADQTIAASSVVLATGAVPKNLAFAEPAIIPLQDAMDSERIHHHCKPEDTVAVFGSSHSAILVLRNLVESGVRRVINFYRTPLRYAVYLDDLILFDDTGLKGPTAEWAKENVDGTLPANLERVYSNEANIAHQLPQCDKVVYAVGFDRRTLPVIEGMGPLSYIEECGIIAPGLFGLGIAYPEGKYNALGIYEYRVGLWKFMDYLQRIVPIWMKYST